MIRVCNGIIGNVAGLLLDLVCQAAAVITDATDLFFRFFAYVMYHIRESGLSPCVVVWDDLAQVDVSRLDSPIMCSVNKLNVSSRLLEHVVLSRMTKRHAQSFAKTLETLSQIQAEKRPHLAQQFLQLASELRIATHLDQGRKVGWDTRRVCVCFFLCCCGGSFCSQVSCDEFYLHAVVVCQWLACFFAVLDI